MASIVVYSALTGISPMPTLPTAKKAIIKNIPDNFCGTIVDVGAGWGTLTASMAKRFPNSTVVGYELSPLPFLVAKARMLCHRNGTVYRKNFFKVSLHDADIVVCYLFPQAMGRLKDKFEKELKPGATIISNTFAVPGWQAEEVYDVGGVMPSKVYIYRRRVP